ncbi:MAG: hypothetical protein JO246_12045, partial [Frankiaceae bacterium]|nr:hypothetical protein [Frankiaceae bacterium]
RFAFYTFGVVALYVVLALTTRVVLIGVIPIMMSIRSLNAREKLAPIALVAAIVSVGIAFAVLSGH